MDREATAAEGSFGWLTGAEVVRQRDLGHIVITPFSPDAVNPNSYNYTLGTHLCRITNEVIDLRGQDEYEEVIIADGGTRLEPGELYLGTTRETFGSALFASLITGRSSVGRKFVTNHVTAGLIDVGFVGQITLEITVQRPTIIYPGIPFGQIYWYTIAGAPVQYAGKYQGQRLPTTSRLAHDDGAAGTGPPTQIIFEAHATSVDNERRRASGHADPALSDVGRAQAVQLGLRYTDVELDAVFCSDLARARQTAEIAFANRDVKICSDPRLRECDYGELTQAPELMIAGERAARVNNPYPGGKSYSDCAREVRAFLEELKIACPGGTVLVIGHRATQYSLDHWLRGVSLADAISASWQWQPGWTYLLRRR
jgi:deoxycytidine triphosphate deaminase